jgi:preprotein translocase subunit SecG
MLTILLILIIVACLLLTLLVLIQNPKGGIAANFVAPSQIMGVKRSTDVVEKATWYLAVALIVLSLASNFLRPTDSGADAVNESRIKESIEQQSVPAAPQPAQPAQTQPAQEQPAQEQPAAQPAQ